MRLPVPPPVGTIPNMLRNRQDWPLRWSLIFKVLPLLLCAIVGAALIGYFSSSTTLYESLASTPLIEAKTHALIMSNDLKKICQEVETISRKVRLANTDFHEIFSNLSPEVLPIIAEIGVKKATGKTKFFFHEGEKIHEIVMDGEVNSPYSAFAQLKSLPIREAEFTIFPAVITAAPKDVEGQQRFPVIRIATKALGTNDIIFVGISLASWARKLSVYTSDRSPLKTHVQDGALQVAYFFDNQGWILFEMSSFSDGENFYPDIARRGLTGDLGRTGFDAAFRPAALHRDFWEMVVAIKEKISGWQQAPAGLYLPTYSNLWGFTCYAPVTLNTAQGKPEISIGGIVFFESSTLPGKAFQHFFGLTMAIAISVIFFIGFILYRAGKSISNPLKKITLLLSKMSEEETFSTISISPTCEEHQRLQSSMNEILVKSAGISNERDTLKSARSLSNARLPVNFSDYMSSMPTLMDHNLIGSSKEMQYVREQISKAGRTGADVLVWGETGTGKELVASAIHAAGNHSHGPFVSINCGALDENLLLDALFGHIKGAFSEAKTDRKGAFLAAEGGTLHLDEIANASLKVQQSLLRALSVRRIRPLGTDKEIPYNARVVAATNVDLRDSVRRGDFREDLFYRLAIISIRTPSLREHKHDIPELIAYYMDVAAKEIGIVNPSISKGALDLLTSYEWPGNVRELRNCLTRALVFAEGEIILRQHISLEYETYAPIRLQSAMSEQTVPSIPKSGEDTLPAEYLWPVSPQPNLNKIEEKEAMENLAKKEASPHINDSIDDFSDILGMDGLPKDLNLRQRKALKLILLQGGLTRIQYEDSVGKGVTSRTVQNDIKQLIDWGILTRKGAGRSTYYVLRITPQGVSNA